MGKVLHATTFGLLSETIQNVELSANLDGHGPFPVLSAHGRTDVHESFQPAQIEYDGEPHEGQNLTFT